MITDRRPFRAVMDGATGTGTENLSFSDANKTFPNSGYLLIGKEILKYTGISSGALTGITRGILGSTIENQVSDASEVLYLDNIIQTGGLRKSVQKDHTAIGYQPNFQHHSGFGGCCGGTRRGEHRSVWGAFLRARFGTDAS